MKIAIGNDHAGTTYKDAVFKHLLDRNVEIKNFGTDSKESVDYPDFIHPVARAVENKEVDWGIVICGSGNGASMSANKHQGIRCALCWNFEITSLARQHNNANILSLPARFISLNDAIKMVDIFMDTDFEGGRHDRRTGKIKCG